MLIPKPNKPEELYKFFAYGLPLTPTSGLNLYYCNYIRKRGWNVLISPPDREYGYLELSYYVNWRNTETWSLKVAKYEHASIKQN